GTQGETRGALSRLAKERIDDLRLVEGDTVVLSSRVIPGNDREVHTTIDDLLRKGAIVRSWLSDRAIHTSGHAHRAEQRRMIDLVRPRAFIPVHGTMHQLFAHAETARAAGVPSVLVIENGDVVELADNHVSKFDRVEAGRVFVNDEGVEVPPSVLGERARLGNEGFVHITLVEGPNGLEAHVITQGVIDPEDGESVLEQARVVALRAYTALEAVDPAEEARLAVRRVFQRETGARPETHITVVTGPR